MTLHRPGRPYSKPHAQRQLAAAQAALASWEAVQPRDWRERADRHQAIRKWSAEVGKWERVLAPKLERFYSLPF